MAANTALFAKTFEHMHASESVIEFGANIGHLLPKAELSAIEVNATAVAQLKNSDALKVYPMSILDFQPDYERDLAFTKGVLIHINPDSLPDVYDKLYRSSRRYICVAEYYNPTPVEINYRGNEGYLFKRDFAGELLERFDDLRLVDYGVVYYRDPQFPLDDVTWFLMKKND